MIHARLDRLHLGFGIFFGESVMLFDLAQKLVALAIQQQNVIIGQLGPGFLDGTFELFGLALDLFLVHHDLHCATALQNSVPEVYSPPDKDTIRSARRGISKA